MVQRMIEESGLGSWA